MEDKEIIQLYRERSEEAVRQTESAYGRYLFSIAQGILSDEEDSRECVNDVLLRAWNSIPPAEPACLQTWLGKVTRNLAIDRYRVLSREKRGGGRVDAALDELLDITDAGSLEDETVESIVLSDALRNFARSLGKEHRMIFLKRYWYFMSISEIAAEMGMKESKVRVTLMRCRRKLRDQLKKEGIEL